jgi:CRP-like cAMP-binding protein
MTLICAAIAASAPAMMAAPRGGASSAGSPSLGRFGRPTVNAALSDVIAEAFPHSSDEKKRLLGGLARVRRFRPGEDLIQQGDTNSLALVLAGHVAVRRTTVDGRQIIVRIITHGGMAGILPLAARPASGDAVALTAGSAAIWRGDEIRTLASSDSGLALDLLDQALTTVEGVVWRLDGMLHQASLRRVARVLIANAHLFFADPPVLTRADLPDMIGTSREMTGRVLRILETLHLVTRVDRTRLRLLDAAGLEHLAEFGPDGPPAAERPSSAPPPSAVSSED